MKKKSKINLNKILLKIGFFIYLVFLLAYSNAMAYEENDYEVVKKLGLEDVIGIKGIIVERPKEAINKDLITGYIDVEVNDLFVFNESDPVPFDINERQSASDIIVILGGVRPSQDHAEMYKLGVAAIYGPGAHIPAAAEDIVSLLGQSQR